MSLSQCSDNMNIEKIESQVLERVKPDKEERETVRKISKELLEILDNELDGKKEPKVVGSVSKGTYLKDPDIDIFVKFPLSASREKMEEKILNVGKKILEDTKEKYAEHPYIYGYYKDHEIDIVPCYDIEDVSEMKSAVDRTPFHTEYIIDNLDEDQKEETILFKAYLEGIGAYGAKAEVWGFSGYLCELLILHYGSFKEVIKAASDWKPGKKIEIVEGQKDFDDPLVVIDPIDPERNVASPVSMEKFSLFVLSSKQFLKEPKMTFFFPNDVKTKDREKLSDLIKKRGTELIGLKVPKPDIVEDNLYPQVQKCLRKLLHQTSHKDFKILHSDYFIKDGEILFIVEVENSKLPEIKKHRGPPIWVDNTEEFLDKYGKAVYLEEDRMWVDKGREYTEIKNTLINIMDEVDLGSDLNPFFPDKCRFIGKNEILRSEKRPLTEFFDNSFPWER
ncbi:MAG: CCA tRNA nucleotidyltransferase [Candidatus Thermoplasmatota archaeon]|nr:CCA tRNA nucleotidyltransferase [Candidatus Thermoplasmatota archaeon]